MKLLLILLVFAGTLSAQSIDRERSRFLTTPNGRSGTYAPFRLALKGLEGQDTVTVHSRSPGVTLDKQVAVAGVGTIEVVIPVLVGEGSSVEVSGSANDEFAPTLPTRRIEPDYERPYG